MTSERARCPCGGTLRGSTWHSLSCPCGRGPCAELCRLRWQCTRCDVVVYAYTSEDAVREAQREREAT